MPVLKSALAPVLKSAPRVLTRTAGAAGAASAAGAAGAAARPGAPGPGGGPGSPGAWGVQEEKDGGGDQGGAAGVSARGAWPVGDGGQLRELTARQLSARQRANSVARDSRTTVTRIWPG